MMKILKTKKYSILSNILKYSFVVIFAFMIITSVAFGDPPDNTVGTEVTTKINNPLGDNIDTIPKFIEEVINIVLIVGVPIVVLAIIYVGFLFVKAQGKPEEITKAKKAFVYTLVGAALLLGAFVIANAIGKTVDEIKSST